MKIIYVLCGLIILLFCVNFSHASSVSVTNMDISDTLEVGGTSNMAGILSQHIHPKIHNTYYLGTSALRWNRIYVDRIYGSAISNSVSSSSQTTAASSSAVKNAYDNANSRVLKSGDTMSGSLTVNDNIYANAFIYTSDFRLKTNINYINSSLDRILNLNGVSFSWKNSVNNKTNIGLIAQNVEKYFPEVVHTNNITGMKAIEYANLVAPLIESIKEQQTQIEKQQKIIENQQNQLDELRREIENLKISIN